MARSLRAEKAPHGVDTPKRKASNKKLKWLTPPREVASTCHPNDLRRKDSSGKLLHTAIVWRNAILGPDGPRLPATRFVLLALAHHMDELGYCFPSINLLALETCYSQSTVKRHLKVACSEGWLIRTTGMGYARGWRRYEYEAAIPAFTEDGGITVNPRLSWTEARKGRHGRRQQEP